MSKFGIAVLGYAHGHVGSYSSGIKTFDDCELVACWDHSESRGTNRAANFGIDYSPIIEDVLGRDDVQLCIIGAETNRHAEVVEAAAAAGKDIILQKPMALSMADCDRIIEAVDRAGVWFSMAFQMRYDPVNVQMKKLVSEGAVGRVGIVRRRHCLSMLLNPDTFQGDTAWHIDPVQNLGMWMDDASHASDWLYWMLGSPVSVMAEIDNILTHRAADDSGEAIYRFANGEMGLLMNSSVILAAESTSEIYGDKGVILENYGDGPSTGTPPPPGATMLKMFQSEKRDQGWQILPAEIPASHGWRIANVTRNILDEYKAGKVQVSARDAKISTGMILGAYESARTGTRVSLPL
ncbi:Gfo/Idh/MocA family oxidoreductase [bacterium]|nr:Gfo/Idh/MocA family oxidoreductase [bacterium]